MTHYLTNPPEAVVTLYEMADMLWTIADNEGDASAAMFARKVERKAEQKLGEAIAKATEDETA